MNWWDDQSMFSVKIITQVGRKVLFNADFMFKLELKKIPTANGTVTRISLV